VLHTKWNTNTVQTNHLHARFLHSCASRTEMALATCNAKLKININCLSIEPTEDKQSGAAQWSGTQQAFLQHSYTLLFNAYCHQQTSLNQ